MVFTRTWSDAYEATPAGSEGLATADDYMRAIKVDVRETFEIDHIEMDAAGRGEHAKVTFGAPISTPNNVANKGFIYTKDVSAKAELHFEDEDGNEIQLTSAGVIKLPATAALLAGAQTFSGAKTFSGGVVLDGDNLTCAATETIDGIDVSAHAAGTAKSQHAAGVGTHTHESAGAEGGKLGLAALSSYDSGWFAVDTNASYSKTHGLGALPKLASIWFSQNADGSNAFQVGDVVKGGDSDDNGITINAITTTTCNVITGADHIISYDAGGSWYHIKIGYCRVVLVA
jgi:hypothetical protein